MIDTIVEGARIFDGVSLTPVVTDLAIVGDRIALVTDCREREAVERVPASGLTLCPGFIDVHSHTDELWLVDGRCAGKVLQGVTTEIGGNCGSSVAPLRGLALERRNSDLRLYAASVHWETLDEFFGLVEASGVALNVATLVGLGTTRRSVRGDLEGKLGDEELLAEEALVRDAIEQGALGVSSGLIYTPSRWADSDELTALAAVSAAAGAPLYATHLRSEGDELLEAVDEALEIGERAEVAVQLSHHKAAWKRNWGKVHRTLARVDAARDRGQRVGADVYPYVALWTDLSTILPEDALFGGRERTLERLADPKTAMAIALRLQLDWGESWHDIMLTDLPGERNADLRGRRLDEIAAAWCISPAAAAIRLLREERLDGQAIFFAMNEDDVATVLSASFTCIGSDASARAVDGPTARGLPHPRAFGTFPRVIHRFVRARKTLELGDAIRRMTSLPAAVFNLRDRGNIAPGKYADLALFDEAAFADTATYERPLSYASGLRELWVNGGRVVRAGEQTAARPGRALRSGRPA